MNKKFYIITCFFILLISPLVINVLYYKTNYLEKEGLSGESFKPRSSASNRSDIIVFFNHSSFDPSLKSKFNFYGGTIKNNSEWINKFSSMSGFAGSIPTANISSFSEESSEINVEYDEEIQTYLNYATLQAGANFSSWFSSGYNGDTNSSITIVDSGIDTENEFLKGKIISSDDFVGNSSIQDEFGHGTFISSIISGTGIRSSDSNFISDVLINKTYSHLDLFEEYIPSKNYSFKVISFNTTKIDSQIVIDSSWDLIDSGIDDVWFELYHQSELVNSSHNLLPDTYYKTVHQISANGGGVYDIIMKYHKQLNKIPKFSFNLNVSFYPESYISGINRFTGIANASKLVNYKVINSTGYGYASDLISAMASVLKNKDILHIVSTCLSVGTLGTDVTAVSKVINEVADNGIVVVIAAGNNGIKGSNPLNKLGFTQNSIVVGAINDNDQVSSYSSAGDLIENNVKPDIVAPGGSLILGHRTILGAKEGSTKVTSMTGTSISAAIISGAVNILIDSKWDDWSGWNSQNTSKLARIIKSILLMTASETNLDREDDPNTEIDEAQYSPSSYDGTSSSLKDIHEGYGRINIEAAINALTKYLNINKSIQSDLVSSENNPLGRHVFARRVKLDSNEQYSFQIKTWEENADFELFLYANTSKPNGEPILYQSTRKWYGNYDSFYFTPKYNETECILVVKAYGGEGAFVVNYTNVENIYSPELKIPKVNYVGGQKNTTILSYQEYSGFSPNKNYSIDRYRFYIDYFDLDSSNVPPQEVQVHIVETSKNYTLSQESILDANYIDGALFWTDYIQFPKPGKYHYYFSASDGKHIVRFPIIDSFQILIEFPTDSEQIPYSYDFENGWNNWTNIGTGWNILNQTNSVDNRSLLYDSEWKAIYYGREHSYPSTYTYQPYIITDPYPNGSLISPLFNLTSTNKDITRPFLKFGIRTSINAGDNVYLQINLNWTGWTTLKSYTNEEREWFMEMLNMTDYIGYFVQFRFYAYVDDEFDSYYYKGFVLDYFSIFNYSNSFSPSIEFNETIHISQKSITKFDSIIISCRYLDPDNNYPRYVFLEIDGINQSMINPIGDWNVNQSLNEGDGIRFIKSIVLGDLSNKSFRFHISDGKYSYSSPVYNLRNEFFIINIPAELTYNTMKDGKLIGYTFSEEDLSDYYITGTPMPKESTAWFMGDNTWHLIRRAEENLVYGGRGQAYGGLEQGYDNNWDIKLITKPIHILDEYTPYLTYYYEISLQNEFGIEEDELDRCSVYISRNFGETWELLKEYLYNDVELSGNQTIKLSSYSDETIMIMFSLETNDFNLGIGYGCLLSDIYIGYNPNTDLISPSIFPISISENQIVNSTFIIEFRISDNGEIDSDRIYLYIDDQLVNRNSIIFDSNSNNNTIKYNWDTTKYLDGNHVIKIVVYDVTGNEAEREISVIVQNGNLKNIILLFLISCILVFLSLTIYFVIKRKNKISQRKYMNAEEVRLSYIHKDQIIKRIELLETEDELNRPLTLYCRFCKSWFQNPKFHYVCPNCEHDQIYVAYNCLNCGKWYFKNEPAQDYYCSNKKCEGVRLIRREPIEIKNLLAKEGKVLKTYKKKNDKFSVLD